MMDLISLVLILVGAALYVRAFLGMAEVRNSGDEPFVSGTTEAFGLTNKYLRFKQLSHVGLVAVGAGILVGLSAAVHARKIARRNGTESPLPE